MHFKPCQAHSKGSVLYIITWQTCISFLSSRHIWRSIPVSLAPHHTHQLRFLGLHLLFSTKLICSLPRLPDSFHHPTSYLPFKMLAVVSHHLFTPQPSTMNGREKKEENAVLECDSEVGSLSCQMAARIPSLG